MTYKVCIKAAGLGTRNRYAVGTNKALLPIGQQAAISKIIAAIEPSVPIVVAVGHAAGQVSDYLALAHPDRDITQVEVDRYTGEGSGPGYSLLCCREVLQCPFVFVACDTLVTEKIPEPDSNWIGVASAASTEPFLVAETIDGRVTRFFDKQSEETIEAAGAIVEDVRANTFIGLAGILDFEAFWTGLARVSERNVAQAGEDELVAGELQVSVGLRELLPHALGSRRFTWFDIGTDESYAKCFSELGKGNALLKPEEFTYVEGSRVIKFFADASRASRRAERAHQLDDVTPRGVEQRDHFYAYEFVPGRLLADIEDPAVFDRFMDFTRRRLHVPVVLDEAGREEFAQACQRFYIDKTKARVQRYHERFGVRDGEHVINGTTVPSIETMLGAIDEDWLCDGSAVRFHGDLQPENVVVGDDGNFTTIDWREDFGGLVHCGDLYYDLAKIYHALHIAGEVVRADGYRVDRRDQSVSLNYFKKSNLLEFAAQFDQSAPRHGYDLHKVKVLSALIYLNIAALHHEPYSHLLYFQGKRALHQLLENDSDYRCRSHSALSRREDRNRTAVPSR